MQDVHSVIKKPLFTEKGTMLKEKDNQLLVEVALSANKIEIKKAFESIFNVKVDRVSTVARPGKWKRMGKSLGKTQKRKKAIITLKKGEKLDFIEGV